MRRKDPKDHCTDLAWDLRSYDAKVRTSVRGVPYVRFFVHGRSYNACYFGRLRKWKVFDAWRDGKSAREFIAAEQVVFFVKTQLAIYRGVGKRSIV